MKQSKKGISLAFVIVVVMALMIFSAMLFSAASHSLSMTGTSTEGRQAYLTAKSAIEYAKTLAYDKAKSGGKLVPFSVGHDADGNYAELAAATAPNGTDCYAECTNPGGDGKNWKILAKVKYQNSGQYRQLAYTFTLNWNASVSLPASDFFMAGVNYGSEKVLDLDGYWFCLYGIDKKKSSPYPVVENLPLVSKKSAGCGYLKAPEIILLGDNSSGNFDAPVGKYCFTSEDATAELHSNFIAFQNDIYGHSYDNGNDKAHLHLYPSDDTAVSGILYFADGNGGNCTIQLGGGNGAADTRAVVIPAGYYRFTAGLDIFSLSATKNGYQDSDGHSLTQLSVEETTTPELKKYIRDISFAQSDKTSNSYSLISGADWSNSKGANFESNGVFAGNPTEPSRHNGNHWNVYNSSGDYNLDENAVFTYATSTGWPSSAAWPQYLDPYGNMIDTNDGTHPNAKKYIIYAAKQFFLQFVSRSEDFKLPPTSDVYNVAFNSDLVSLSMAVSDTDAGADADHRPKIVQANDAPSSQFLLTSLSTDENGNHKDVTLVIPNSIDVLYQNGSKSYHIPQGVYQVKSGFNFFDNDVENWTKFWSDCKKANYPISDSGDSGGSGGFTISGGKYADS